MKICWKGKLQTVLLDDMIPVNHLGIPFSLKTNGPELWAILMEKAWAKLHGNYFNIEDSTAEEILHDFTVK